MRTYSKTVAILCLAGAVLVPAAAQTNPYVYMRSNVSAPWDVTSNETDMDDAFGSGNWDNLYYETANAGTLFSPSVSFIYMEGGDTNANALQTFISNNDGAMEAWVNAGGHLFINSAPNQGSGMSLGFGVTLNFDPVAYTSASNNATAIDGTQAIFNSPLSPAGPNFSGGDSFSHAYLTGGDNLVPLIQDDESRTVLAQITTGQGLVMFGGMTVDVFQSPWPNTHNLRVNIICYLAGATTVNNPAGDTSTVPTGQ